MDAIANHHLQPVHLPHRHRPPAPAMRSVCFVRVAHSCGGCGGGSGCGGELADTINAGLVHVQVAQTVANLSDLIGGERMVERMPG